MAPPTPRTGRSTSALAHARAHPRRRDPLAVLRRDPMAGAGFAGALRPLPLVAVLGLILVAAIGVATVGGFLGRPSVVPPPLAPTPSPTAPSPTATPSGPPVPASSPAVVRVDLIDDIGGGAFVEITDQSGTMVDARSGQPAEAGEIAGDIGVANLAGRSDRGRSDVGRQPVRHRPRPDDRAGRPHDHCRGVSPARATRSAWPACSSCASTAPCRRARSSRRSRPAVDRGQARAAVTTSDRAARGSRRSWPPGARAAPSRPCARHRPR